MARWTPRIAPVKTVLVLQPRAPVSCQAVLRPVVAGDSAALVDLYVAAFADCIEFCDCDEAYVRRQAEQDIARYFGGHSAPPLLEFSRVAFAPDTGAAVGAMLVREGKHGRVVSELLFIAPAWQRRGVGTALMTEAVNLLPAAGHAVLVTGYALGNLASEAFYHRFGFVDAPSETVAQKRLRYYEQELRRHAPGELSAAETTRLTGERDHWLALVEAWEARPLEDRFADRDE